MEMFFRPDLILLHAPSVYDFRKLPILFGPISDLVPSTPIFEMYPVGFSSIAEHLERNGIHVRIINLALRMLKDKNFDAEKLIAGLHPRAFGIDLHWLPHAHGSLEIAALCKKYHPDIPVTFGGYSATYFHEELIRYPQVDFVVRGDSAEEPLRQLLSAFKGGTSVEAIPNLTWKDKGGNAHVNPLTHLVADLDEYSNNYPNLFRSALKYFDLKSLIPIHDWWEYPITAVMTCRGCTHNCVICGGSRYALDRFCSRNACAFRDPEKVAQDILSLSRYTNAPIFVVGDLRQAGNDYARTVLSRVRPGQPRNQVVLELFTPALESYLREVAETFPHFNFEISPESHDEEIRRASGKFYTNEEMESSIRFALDHGCSKFDVFFMIGLPLQTSASVMQTIDYCERLMQTFDKRLNLFISPLAPFLDPGSMAFEKAGEVGYKVFCKTLEDYRQALLSPSWKYTLSYETKWMTREEIVRSSYEAGLGLNRLKERYGLVDAKTAGNTEERILKAREMIRQVDEIILLDEPERSRKLMALKEIFDRVSMSTVCDKEEIKWPVFRWRLNFPNIIKTLLARRPAQGNLD
ncbi:MAG: TIGR04190 family B12-binding domain/radical SAM domain protein [Deltaproteobacteria bacterium]|nr:TIGR04190 family B12-binding domain/radical SAM domain protein [Deltaproteobacteria bacterium]